MTRVLHHPRAEEAALLAPLAKRPRAGVGSMPPRDDVNFDDLPDPVTKVISFDDVRPETKDAPAAAPAARRVLRPNAGRLVLDFLAAAEDLPQRTAGHRIAPVIDRPARPEVLLYPDHGAERMAAHLAAIGIYVDLFPNIGGEHAVALALAPIAAMLDGGESL